MRFERLSSSVPVLALVAAALLLVWPDLARACSECNASGGCTSNESAPTVCYSVCDDAGCICGHEACITGGGEGGPNDPPPRRHTNMDELTRLKTIEGIIALDLPTRYAAPVLQKLMDLYEFAAWCSTAKGCTFNGGVPLEADGAALRRQKRAWGELKSIYR